MLGTFDSSETTFLSVLVMLLNLSHYLHCVEVSWPNTATAKMNYDDMMNFLARERYMLLGGESMWTVWVQDRGPWTGRISWPAEWLLAHVSTHNTLFPKMDSLGMDQLSICHIILLWI
jgi:hypothetical protein